jgi:monoamine oxidase
MSYLSFNNPNRKRDVSGKRAQLPKGSMRKAFSDWLIKNHGEQYATELKKQRALPKTNITKLRSSQKSADTPLVGIIGGGFAGLYSGLILQSLGIECEVFESSDRVGGRIDTWYSTKYDEKDPNNAGLYGEVGGMRVPQFSPDMLPVQHLGLSLNAVLKRNKMVDKMVKWRKFYYDSDVQRLRYNNMEAPIIKEDANLNDLNFGRDKGGDLHKVWVTPTSQPGGKPYLPINMVLEKVNGPFLDAFINDDFETALNKLLKFDNHSMWSYLTNVFKLEDLGEYYDHKMGKKDHHLPYNVASYLETLNVGTGMYAVSFVEMVLAVYDWDGSKNPYKPEDSKIYMITMNKGMQHFPDACRSVLNLDKGVLPEDGYIAQIEIGMIENAKGQKGYSPSNLTEDAQPPSSVPEAHPPKPIPGEPSQEKNRVFMNHKVVQVEHDPLLYDTHGGMRLKVKVAKGTSEETLTKEYPYVISTLPNGAYLSGELKTNFFDKLSFAKTRAIRQCNYMPSFKAFITFKTQFWATLGERQGKGLGVGTSDRSNRQIVYPSYGYDAEGGVLQVYCWAQDAERMGALTDEERVNECLKGIAYLYPEPEVDVYAEFAGYKPEETTKTWFWDNHAGGGAFALFGPGQFTSLYETLLTPEFDGHLNIAGECCSVHHGWIVGALDSAYNAVNNILHQMGETEKIEIMERMWGRLTAPDVASAKI